MCYLIIDLTIRKRTESLSNEVEYLSKRFPRFKMFLREIRLQLLKPITSCFSNTIWESGVTFLKLTFGMCFHLVNNHMTMWRINSLFSIIMLFRNEQPVGRNEMNILKVLIFPWSNSCSIIEQITVLTPDASLLSLL